MDIQQLNKQFTLANQLEFIEGKGGLIMAVVNTEYASALISTYAGQVLSFIPKGEEDLLFVSEKAHYKQGKATKGGIPVCWPWFGSDPEGRGRPGHGFVRSSQWQVLATKAEDNAVVLELGIENNETIKEMWPDAFSLKIIITIGKALEISLVTKNVTTQDMTITQGLHTYFKVGDIAQTSVLGLENKTFLDKVDGGQEKTQQGAVAIDQEVDRIYLGVNNQLIIEDKSLNRKIIIDSENSNSAVVWNPWIEKAQAMGDFEDSEYLKMICVETTNAASDVVTIAPDQEYCLVAKYHIEK